MVCDKCKSHFSVMTSKTDVADLYLRPHRGVCVGVAGGDIDRLKSHFRTTPGTGLGLGLGD